MKLPLLLAGLLASTTAVAAKTPITTNDIAALTSQAEQLRHEICGARAEGYMGVPFEDGLANTLGRFSSALYVELELKGLTIAEKLEKLLPGNGYNVKTDEEAAEELKKRQKLRVESVVIRPPPITNAATKSCKELQGTVSKFSDALEALLYSVAERCDGKCAKDGTIVKAVRALEDIYMTNGFMARVRDAERMVRCQQSLADYLLVFKDVGEALMEGKMPKGGNGHPKPCQKRVK